MITGSTEEGQKYKENVYVPTHFNDLPVYYTFTSYTGNGGALGTNTMQVNCENLYFNYIYEYFPTFSGTAKYSFNPKTLDSKWSYVWTHTQFTTSKTVYISEQMYQYTKGRALISPNADRFKEIEGYILLQIRKDEAGEVILTLCAIKANVNYHFNYDNAPNEDYFFINDFEWGGLIEDTPYEPIRKGYTFAGWYKEPKCVNAWDFEKDTLPTATYNEEGYVTNHTVTHLYAKWTKE